MPKMIFQPKIRAILFNFIIIKAIEYAQRFQVMYVSVLVTAETIILVQKLNSEGLAGSAWGGTRLLGIYCSSSGSNTVWVRGPVSGGPAQ